VKKRARLILNPAAAGGRARRLRGAIVRELRGAGYDIDVHETEATGHAADLAREAARDDAELVLVAGGDGTVHEVANGLLDARSEGAVTRTLAVIPAGSGNDFAKMLYPKPTLKAAFAALRAPAARLFDVGHVTWTGGSEYFINAMGTGVDVEVVRQIERLPRLPGVVGYLVGAVRALLGFRAIPMRITTPAGVRDGRLMIVAVGIGECMGGGFYAFPGARPDDGRFDVCMVEEMGLARVARVLPRVMRGRHTGMRGVHMSLTDSMTIEMPEHGSLFFQLDGELREPAGISRLDIALVPAALRVVGAGSPRR
jgi:diacylglycerol kinase (ATP)